MKNILLPSIFFLLTLNISYGQEWKTIEKFSGNGIKNTPAFTIDQSEWRIVYKSEGNSLLDDTGAGHIFQLFLLKPGEEMFEGEIITNDLNTAY
ncbi:MAG: hypothetical protein MK198_08950 [Gracilimonas sp.]|uniref:hypothetical protein n=1 Tax=Gracilimonas sp. TaxID=1974203 RepID=UPI00375144E7|nr:hypothetical protein [Gracilimonas sp.]